MSKKSKKEYSFEKWFYKTFPGSKKSKKRFLSILIIAMFASSIYIYGSVLMEYENNQNQLVAKINNIEIK